MIVFGCDTCCTLVKVHGEQTEINKLILNHPRWKCVWPCITSGCSDTLGLVPKQLTSALKKAQELGIVRELRLSPQEFFRALCGFGTPEEIAVEPEVIRAFLLSSEVVDLLVKMSPTRRTILERLDLANGTSLHLASSPHGAMIYKVTRKRDEPKLGDDNSNVHQGSETDCLPGDGRDD